MRLPILLIIATMFLAGCGGGGGGSSPVANPPTNPPASELEQAGLAGYFVATPYTASGLFAGAPASEAWVGENDATAVRVNLPMAGGTYGPTVALTRQGSDWRGSFLHGGRTWLVVLAQPVAGVVHLTVADGGDLITYSLAAPGGIG